MNLTKPLKVPFSIRIEVEKLNTIAGLAPERNSSLWIRAAIDEKLKRDTKINSCLFLLESFP
jgi:hypothetical protein